MQVNVTSGYGKTRFLSDAYKAALASCDSVDDLERKIVFKSDDPVLGKPGADVPAYKLSKAALNRGTQILAKAFKGTARVNSVEPGWCKTDM
jgi:NAD(P)-dependent dehydrogenase (short-subunit alcohol dehydrogenase family)